MTAAWTLLALDMTGLPDRWHARLTRRIVRLLDAVPWPRLPQAHGRHQLRRVDGPPTVSAPEEGASPIPAGEVPPTLADSGWDALWHMAAPAPVREATRPPIPPMRRLVPEGEPVTLRAARIAGFPARHFAHVDRGEPCGCRGGAL